MISDSKEATTLKAKILEVKKIKKNEEKLENIEEIKMYKKDLSIPVFKEEKNNHVFRNEKM